VPPMTCDDCTCRRLFEEIKEDVQVHLASIEDKVDKLGEVIRGGFDGRAGLVQWQHSHQEWHAKRQAWVQGLASTAFSTIHPVLKTAAAAVGGAGLLYLTQVLGGP